jgi:hypothetical protein
MSAPYQARMTGGDSSTNVEQIQQLLAAAVKSHGETVAKLSEATTKTAELRNRTIELLGSDAGPSSLSAAAFIQINSAYNVLASIASDIEQLPRFLNEIPKA